MVDVASSLTSALGMSSGINTAQLVADLTDATYQPKLSNLNELQSANSGRISAIASAKSSLQTFSDALSKLLESTSYSGQPVSNDPTIASVALFGTGKPTGLPAQLEVLQLASAQVLESTVTGTASSVAGVGTITLTVNGTDYPITLGATTNKLSDLAARINESGAGVTATIITDNSNSRLVLKGETGANQAFTISSAPGQADADLERFLWNGTSGGFTSRQSAQNASVKIDNVPMTFATNEITTAISNLRIDLNRAAPGTKVTLGTDQPTSSMGDLVQQIVDAYNTLKVSLNTATRTSDGQGSSSGLLSNDRGARDMAQRLARLASTQLTPDGTYKTLNDLGVSTNRDGTWSLNKATLKAALDADPEGVTQMLNPSVKDATHVGIAGALKSVTDYLNGNDGPLAVSKNVYDKLASSYQKSIAKVNEERASYTERLTRTYSSMQSRLLQFKATQSYLEQQISVWTNKGN